MRLKTVVFCLALGGATLASHALNLGRARGAAWIGQPLSMTVSVQLDTGQTTDGLCPEADVFYADSKVEPYRVQVSVEPNSQGDTATLRIQSSAIIDEPVVTLYVRAGCNSKSTRRYVLLADYATDVVPAAPSEVPDAAQRALRPNPPNTVAAPVEAVTVPPAPPRAAAPTPRAERTQKAEKKPPTARDRTPATTSTPAVAPTKPAAPRGARLQLDPLENLTERIKTLEATTSSAPLQELVQDSQRIQQLQNDVKSLLNQAAKNEANLLALRERLDKAEAERISNSWWVALLVLVAAATAAAVVALNRWASTAGRVAGPQPEASGAALPLQPESDQMDPADHWSPAPAGIQPATKATTMRRHAPAVAGPLDLGTDDFRNSVSVSTSEDVSNSDMMGFDVPKLLHRDLHPKNLLDLQQQAEFFVTLGNANKAIEVLEQRIRQTPDDCPLLYLQLLEIANQHNLKTDFRQYREECMRWFNVDVPEFALFRHEGRSLEDYPELLAHIVRLWPNSKVMDVIETCALHDSQAQAAARFDMAAFRELIVLHAIARYQAYHRADATAPDLSEAEHIALDL